MAGSGAGAGAEVTPRIAKELKLLRNQLESGSLPQFRGFGFHDNTVFVFFKAGKDDAPFAGTYEFEIKLAKDHPHAAPVIKCTVENGHWTKGAPVCINGISHFHREGWSPSLFIAQLLVGLWSFFIDVNNKEPYVGRIWTLTLPVRRERIAACASNRAPSSKIEFTKEFPEEAAEAGAPPAKRARV